MHNNSLILFIKKLILFLILVFILDLSIGFVLKRLYFKIPRKITYGILDTKEDVLIYGSSKAYRNYNPSIFKEKLGLSCFNNGMDGQNIYYHYALLASSIERYKPKLVLLDLFDVDYTITSSDWSMDRLNVLLPFYGQNKSINEVIELRSKYEKIKMLSSIYPYNSLFVDILKSIHLKKDSTFGSQGYLPAQKQVGMIDRMTKFNFKKDSAEDQIKTLYLKKIFQICKQKDIKLVVIMSPMYSENAAQPKILEKIAVENQIPFWNFTHISLFADISLFSDPAHLNETGANKYSLFIAEKIEKELFKNK